MLVLVGGCWWLGAGGDAGVCVLVLLLLMVGVVGCWWLCWFLCGGAAVADGWMLFLVIG